MVEPIIRYDDSESNDPHSGELVHVTPDELETIRNADDNEVVIGDPAMPPDEQQADFTVFNNKQRPS